MLERSIAAFENCASIDSIIVVMNPNYFDIANDLISRNDYKKYAGMITGGGSRFESSFNALEKVHQMLKDEKNNVLIHDAARAFVSPEVIERVIEALENADGAQPIVPVSETIVQHINGQWITQNRDDYATVQTPQGFCFEKIYAAYQRAVNTPTTSWVPTDDISVLQEYSKNPRIVAVAGDYRNRKITFPEDLHL
ncbi:hypothetical protein FACS1894125_3770 [Actinomycetota bacterium]|nr:hypothetical protein FACS1894125_3770 [Actinomycetota bacterium]